MPGIVKIGATIGSPEERATEISAATGVPLPYDLSVSFSTPHPFAVEAAVHSRLNDFRVSHKREFFSLPVDVASRVICDVISGRPEIEPSLVCRFIRIVGPHDLGRSIFIKRKSLGLTQAKLSLVSGIGRRAILEIEAGKTTAQVGIVMHLLDVLQIAVATNDGIATGNTYDLPL